MTEKKNVIFIHAAVIGRFVERIQYYLGLIYNSGLYNQVENIYICYVVNKEQMTENILLESDKDSKIIFKNVSPNLQAFELPTLSEIYNFALEHLDYNILYIHTKGITGDINPCIEDWVKYMSHFCINKWEHCVKQLLTSSSCGVDLRTWPVLHYSGNFWWARANHIARLPSPVEFADLARYPNPLNSPRHNQEFWICHRAFSEESEHCGIWESHINCLERHLHRYDESCYI